VGFLQNRQLDSRCGYGTLLFYNKINVYRFDFAAASLAEASSLTETTLSSTNPATEASGSDKKSLACEDGLFFDLRAISL
jgi:hypothetical protein